MVNYQRGDFGRSGMGCPCDGIHSNGDFGASWGNMEAPQMGEDVQNLSYSYSSAPYSTSRGLVNWLLVLGAAYLGYKYFTGPKRQRNPNSGYKVYRAKNGKWAVERTGEDSGIQFFDTEAEARAWLKEVKQREKEESKYYMD